MKPTKKTKAVKRVMGAQPTVALGIRFQSKLEARRYVRLVALQRAGRIADLRRQVKVPLQGQGGPILTETGRQMFWVADFGYLDTATGANVLEDTKGHPTEIYLLKRAICAAQGITIKEVRALPRKRKETKL